MKTPLFKRREKGGTFTVAGNRVTTGNIWWVDSGNTSTGANAVKYGQNPDNPFLSISYAFSSDLVQADNGDIIYVMPGHTETVATDGALTADIAGVTIVGLGKGDARPVISIISDTAAAAIFSGTGIVIDNMRFSMGMDAATDPIQISGDGCVMENCEIIEATACEALDLISVSGDRCVLHDLKIRGRNTTDSDALCAIHLVGTDDIEIYNIYAYGGDWKEGVILNEGTLAARANIHDCTLRTEANEDLCLIMHANATGFIGPNINCILVDNAANITEAVAGAKMYFFQPIHITNADGEATMETTITATVDGA